MVIGLEEMVEDEAALPGQAQAVFREVLGERLDDLARVALVLAAFVDDELFHPDRVSVWTARRNILVMSPCYNFGMKRLWPLPVLLLLALPLRAQVDVDAASPEELAPPEGQSDDAAPADNGGPVSEPETSEEPPSEDEAESPAPSEDDAKGADDASVNEAPVINVKVESPSITPSEDEEEEESLAPAPTPKKIVPTATLIKRPKSVRSKPSPSKSAKGKATRKPAAVVVKTKAPVVAAEPAPPPVPAVPLTPIPPRNP